MNLKSKSLIFVSTALLALSLASCKSKPKADDATTGDAAAATNTPPAIDNSAMSFDVAGSDSGKIDGLKTVHFEFDKSNLTSSAKRDLQGNVNWMKSHDKVNIQVEGHCDQKGSTEYNLSLGERRAKAVREYMESLGIAKKRLSIISYGKEKPIAHGDSESDMAKNRRANFLPLNQ